MQSSLLTKIVFSKFWKKIAFHTLLVTYKIFCECRGYITKITYYFGHVGVNLHLESDHSERSFERLDVIHRSRHLLGNVVYNDGVTQFRQVHWVRCVLFKHKDKLSGVY